MYITRPGGWKASWRLLCAFFLPLSFLPLYILLFFFFFILPLSFFLSTSFQSPATLGVCLLVVSALAGEVLLFPLLWIHSSHGEGASLFSPLDFVLGVSAKEANRASGVKQLFLKRDGNPISFRFPCRPQPHTCDC